MLLQTSVRGLRSFCVAAKCLSFKHAANQLFLTPSAVSHQIKDLEEHVGIQLFTRKTRSISLTREGHRLYQEIQPLLADLDRALANFARERNNHTITIALPEFFNSELFIPKLSQWTSTNPHINLELETFKGNTTSKKSPDLSIILSRGLPNAAIVHPLFSIRYVAACNKDIYDEWGGRATECLSKVPLLLHQARPWAWHQWAERVCVDDFSPTQIIQFDSMYSVAKATQQGMGIALIPVPISDGWFGKNALIKLFSQELLTNDQYFLIRHEDISISPEILRLCDWIKEKFKQLR